MQFLFQQFLNTQQQSIAIQQAHLQELQKSRLTKAPSNITSFPKLNDNQLNRDDFPDWYDSIVSIIATPEWYDLFDTSTYDIIKDGSKFPDLNKHLYSAIRLCVKGAAQKHITQVPHAWGDGIALIQSLKETYLGSLSRIQLMEIQGTLFGNQHFRKPNETLESYTARTLRMSRDLQENDIPFSLKQLKTSFIFGLGKDFNDIIKKDLLNELPQDWHPMEI